MGGVLVIAETRRGELRDASLEAIAAAREIKDAAGGRLAVLISAPDPTAFLDAVSLEDVDEVLLASTASEHFDPQVMQATVGTAIDECAPSVVLAGHTIDALGYASAVAAEKRLGFASDVVALWWEDGPVTTRDAYGGKLQAELVFPGKGCTVLTLRAGSWPPAIGAGSPTTRTLRLPEPDGSTVHLRFCEAPSGDVDITAADVLVAAGRGIGERENLELVVRLAERLGATLAVSRPLVDAGWAPAARQVGQSGKSVKPRLYLALGISGAVQHLAGIQGAQTVVAVNSDPHAPIFNVADYGVCADLFEVVEALGEQLG